MNHEPEDYRKIYGVFEINTTARYFDDGLHSIRFLKVYQTEDEAIRYLPYEDGYYIVMPVYIKEENKKRREFYKRLDEYSQQLNRMK